MTDSTYEYEIKYGYILYTQIKGAQKRNKIRIKLWQKAKSTEEWTLS